MKVANPAKNTSRRALLKGAPAAALGIAAAGAGLTAAIADPHPNWLKEFRRFRALWVQATNEHEGAEDSAKAEGLWEISEDFERLICQTPAHTAEGLRAQMEWLLEDAADYWGCANHEAAARTVLLGLSAAA